MVREVELLVHHAVPSLMDGTLIIVEPCLEFCVSLAHILDVAFNAA